MVQHQDAGADMNPIGRRAAQSTRIAIQSTVASSVYADQRQNELPLMNSFRHRAKRQRRSDLHAV